MALGRIPTGGGGSSLRTVAPSSPSSCVVMEITIASHTDIAGNEDVTLAGVGEALLAKRTCHTEGLDSRR